MSIQTRQTKAGKTYYFVRVKSGSQLVATKAFDTKRAAETWERNQKHLLEAGRPLPPKRSFTLNELVTMFLAARVGGNPHTVDTDRNNLAALPAAMLARPLASIHADDIRGHLLAELRGGKKPSTVARAKTTLSALFTYADEQGVLHQPHPVRTMKKIPELGVAQRAISSNEVPTPKQVAAVLAALRERRSDIADVFEFMSLTGVRWGELRSIRVHWLSEVPLQQLNVERSHSDCYDEKARNPGAALGRCRYHRAPWRFSANTPPGRNSTTTCSPISRVASSRSASFASFPSAFAATPSGTTPRPPGCGWARP